MSDELREPRWSCQPTCPRCGTILGFGKHHHRAHIHRENGRCERLGTVLFPFWHSWVSGYLRQWNNPDVVEYYPFPAWVLVVWWASRTVEGKYKNHRYEKWALALARDEKLRAAVLALVEIFPLPPSNFIFPGDRTPERCASAAESVAKLLESLHLPRL